MDWNKIKTEYVTSDTSYRLLAEKYGVSRVQIGNVGKKEGWVELRRQHLDSVLTKGLEKETEKAANRLARVNDLTDRLLDKIERAIMELDLQIARNVTKTKVIEYNNELQPDKPTKEIVEEKESVEEISTIVDRKGLKQIASALRDIKEVQGFKSDADKAEQEARIANLRKLAEKDESKNEPIQVSMGEELEDYSG